jgi:hypothetical protein
MTAEILPPSIKSISTVFAVNLSSISYLVEMVEVVEVFSSDVKSGNRNVNNAIAYFTIFHLIYPCSSAYNIQIIISITMAVMLLRSLIH